MKRLMVLGGLLLLLFFAGGLLLHGIEYWRGKRQLEKITAELAQRQIPLTRDALGWPARNADALPPVLAEIFEKADPMETRLAQVKPSSESHQNYRAVRVSPLRDPNADISEREAAARQILADPEDAAALIAEVGLLLPQVLAVWPCEYAEGINSPFGYTAALLSFAQAVEGRASAHLALGENDAAFAGVRTLFHLADWMRNGSLLIEHLVRLSLLRMALTVLWEGVELNQWTDIQLAESQLIAEQQIAHLFPDLGRVIERERVFALEVAPEFSLAAFFLAHEKVAHEKSSFWETAYFVSASQLRPRGWNYLDKAYYLRWTQDAIDACRAGDREMILEMQEAMNPHSNRSWRGMQMPISLQLAPALQGIFSRTLEIEAGLEQLRVGCALELWRRQRGEIPERLEVLVSTGILPRVPLDPFTGRPMIYRKTSSTGYDLYSVGRDGEDDGGSSRQCSQPNSNYDLVWRIR